MSAKDKRIIRIYDTTLRDGAQAEGVSLSLGDKLHIARRLDELGVDYIEGGYPFSNPKDSAFFRDAAGLGLSRAKIVAFGSTRKPKIAAKDDSGLRALIEAGTPVCAIVAKAWDRHVLKVLRTSLKENLRMISDSVSLLKSMGREVIVDAEHFFDGFKANPDYSIATLLAARDSGADVMTLCDTNGGSLPDEIAVAVDAAIRQAGGMAVGIHCHNDSSCAVANTIVAVEHGATLAQGTINGFGERCGNADLCAVIACLALKKGYELLKPDAVSRLTEVSRYVYEEANLMYRPEQPFVGSSAFAHKAGIHVNAMIRDLGSYEHIAPESVGNERRYLVSELSGRSTLLAKLADNRLRSKEKQQRLLRELQNLENEGYQYEAAEGSLDLLVGRLFGGSRSFFKVLGYHVSTICREDGTLVQDATVKLMVGDAKAHTAAEGDGPVNALDGALRKALEPHYPCLKRVRLTDFRVRVINPKAATAARVRVVITSQDDAEEWGTVGVSENIIEASWEALIDSINYKLTKELAKPSKSRRKPRS
ncbi:MAG TPA: citramalate synthase [Candidatus Brocadiia bacterium]|nr:citramalate synthase [Candidatus Brocadiia bacterium]